MKFLGAVIIAAAVIYLAVLMLTFYRGGKFWRSMTVSALAGVAVLVIINLLSSVTGVNLSINGWTLGVSASFGVPGIIAMLAAKLFF